MGLLALLAIGLGIAAHYLNLKARAGRTQMDALRDKTTAFQQERQRNESRMRQPQNQAVLERSVFLNALFARKSFSWTSVMMDLETVLPTGVQVTSIEPVVSKQGDVSIHLKVTGDRDRAVQLVRNLELSKRFLAPRINSESAQTPDASKRPTFPITPQAPAGVVFEIVSGYNPLPNPAKPIVPKPGPDHATMEARP
jgi:type IV pilus assembly protein PilN